MLEHGKIQKTQFPPSSYVWVFKICFSISLLLSETFLFIQCKFKSSFPIPAAPNKNYPYSQVQNSISHWPLIEYKVFRQCVTCAVVFPCLYM